MTCQDLRTALAEKRDLPEATLEHLRECAGCSAMLDALQEPENAPLESRSLRQLESLLTTSLTPARTMPSNATIAILLFAFFIAFSLLMTMPFGYFGFRVLSLGQKFLDYGVILVLGITLAAVIARELVPGSKRPVRTSALLLLGLILLLGTTLTLFQNFDMSRFVALGMPCLKLGLASAVLCGAASSLLLNAGYVTAAVRTGALLGGLAGLAGFAVLALHCPLQNSAHILTWHLGAATIAALAGTLAGYACRNGVPLRSRAV